MKEHELERSFSKTLIPFFESWRRWHFEGKKGIKIEAASIYEEREDAVIILHGKSESFLRYVELAYDLKDKNLGFYFMDQRGMGFSERETEDTKKVHVSDFNDYVDDFSFFVESVRKKVKGNLYIIAHSMGGAVAVKFLGKNPDIFKKAVLSSPMLGLNSKIMGFLISSFYVFTGRGKSYLPMQRNSSANGGVENTSSRIRWNLWKQESFKMFPELNSGGVTCRWLYETLKAINNIGKTDIKTKTLLFQAGEDTIVENSRSMFLAKNNPDFITFHPVELSKHEILMERDGIRDKVIAETVKFLLD